MFNTDCSVTTIKEVLIFTKVSLYFAKAYLLDNKPSSEFSAYLHVMDAEKGLNYIKFSLEKDID